MSSVTTAFLNNFICKAKTLPKSLGEDLDEGEVTEEDSADEMEECFKLKNLEVCNGYGFL